MLRIAALWWCGPGKEDLEYLCLENGPCISARTLNLPQSAATIQGAVGFPRCLSSGAQGKRSEVVALHLRPSRIAATVHPQPRKPHAKACTSTASQNAGYNSYAQA